MNSNIKHLMLWVVIIAVAGLLIAVVKQGQGTKDRELIFSEFMNAVTANKSRKPPSPAMTFTAS